MKHPCKQCQKEIPLKDGESEPQRLQRKFCDENCAALFVAEKRKTINIFECNVQKKVQAIKQQIAMTR